MSTPKSALIVGAGPAGLFAAERLAGAGWSVTVVERLPSVARKFLMAGRGGLNLTHSEPDAAFGARYAEASAWLAPMLAAFPPSALRAWAEGLGQPTFVGASGRVFPTAMKASPLLRAWLGRLADLGVVIRTRTEWRGWTPAGEILLATPEGEARLTPDAVLLAMGGASWPRLGSDGGWVEILRAAGAEVAPLRPANCGFEAGWSPVFAQGFAGQPLKGVALTHAGRTVRGEAMITRHGLEGGAVYALSAQLREAIVAEGPQILQIDLRPDMTRAALTARLAAARPGLSVSNLLKKTLKLSPAAAALVREGHGPGLDRQGLAAAVKAVPVRLTATRPIDRAISSAGGVTRDALDEGLMLRSRPGVWAAGEMLDWEAPTGGYLLQASFATGLWAAQDILKRG